MMEVVDVNDGGDIKFKKVLEVGEVNLFFFIIFKFYFYYNVFLFLYKNDFFILSLKVRVEEEF